MHNHDIEMVILCSHLQHLVSYLTKDVSPSLVKLSLNFSGSLAKIQIQIQKAFIR